MYTRLFPILVALLANFVLGVDYTLINNNADWEDPGSWEPVGVPGKDDNVFIPGGYNCSVFGDVSVNKMEIEGVLNIENASLTLYGDSLVFGRLNILGTSASPSKLLIGNDLSIGGQLSTIEMWNGLIDSIEGKNHQLKLIYVQRGREVHPPLRLVGHGEIRVGLINQVWVWASHENQILKLSGESKIGVVQERAGKSSWDAQFGGILKVNTEVSGDADWIVVYGKCVINYPCHGTGNVLLHEANFVTHNEFCTTGLLTVSNSNVKIKTPRRSEIGTLECD